MIGSSCSAREKKKFFALAELWFVTGLYYASVKLLERFLVFPFPFPFTESILVKLHVD